MPTSNTRSGKTAFIWSSPVPSGMAAVMADNFRVATRLLDQRVGEDAGIGGGVGLGLRLCARDYVKRGNAVVLIVGRLGRRIALALLGHHVDKHGPVLHVAHVLQDRQKVVEIVAVDRPDVIETRAPRTRCRRSKNCGRTLPCAGPCRRRTSAGGAPVAWPRRAASDRRGLRRGAPDKPTSRLSAARSTCRCH